MHCRAPLFCVYLRCYLWPTPVCGSEEKLFTPLCELQSHVFRPRSFSDLLMSRDSFPHCQLTQQFVDFSISIQFQVYLLGTLQRPQNIPQARKPAHVPYADGTAGSNKKLPGMYRIGGILYSVWRLSTQERNDT